MKRNIIKSKYLEIMSNDKNPETKKEKHNNKPQY